MRMALVAPDIFSFSNGGHESSKALAVLLSRFVLSLALPILALLLALLLLGARLLVLRLRPHAN